MRNHSNNDSQEEEWELLSDDWTEAEAEENSQEGNHDSIEDVADTEEQNGVPETEELPEEVTLNAEEEIVVEEEDIMSMDENQLLLQDETCIVEEEEEDTKEAVIEEETKEEELTPGVRLLVDMGFSVKDSKTALFYSDGDMNQAVSDLSGEDPDWHRMHRAKKDAAIQLKLTAKQTAEAVGKAVESGAAHVKKVAKDHDVEGKARVVAHKAKLTARSVGRDIENINAKYHLTEALATFGAAVTVAMLTRGNVKAATTTAAVAGTAFVAGETMKNHRPSDQMYE